MKYKIQYLMAALTVCCAYRVAFAYEKPPAEVVRALKTTLGSSVSTGLVFIDGKYVKPPYRVTRSGNQILLNDKPVTGQLVAWEKFLETQPANKLKVTEVEVSEDAPAAKSAPAEKDGVDPAAPKDGGNKPPAKNESAAVRVTIAPKRLAAAADDLDDFNADADSMKLTDIPADTKEDKERQKRAEDAKREEAEEAEGDTKAAEASSTDANGDEVDPASPEGEAAAKAEAAKKPAPAPKKTRKVVTLDGTFDLNFRAQKLLKPIDAYRMKLEATLRRGGYLFFGTNPARKYCVGRTSEAVAAKELLKKLPELMRGAKDSEQFCDSVRSAGLFSYINLQISQDLYRNRTDYYNLIQRRKAMDDDDKLNKMLNSHGR